MDEEWSFGEIIHKDLFEEEIVEVARRLLKRNIKPFQLAQERRELMSEKDYVFITIYKSHASIITIDKQTFFEAFKFHCDVFGQMIDCSHIGTTLPDADEQLWPSATLQNYFPFRQYHVCLNDTGTKYELVYNWYYMNWFKKSRSFFIGETGLNHFYRELICLTVVPKRYRLVLSDCLEFAKNFAYEILHTENGIRRAEIAAIFRTLRVSENFITAGIEDSSRQNRSSGWSGAVMYFSSFDSRRLLISIAIIGFSFGGLHLIHKHISRG